jgi:cytochrome c2/mono/diheme cytochrome c family protein
VKIQNYRRAGARAWLIGLLLVWMAASVVNAHSTAMNYLLNCQGCHKADGSGQPGYVPDFRESVARFLAIPQGREFLGRVPGASQSLLSDPDRAAVLNWILVTFDSEHVPANFKPYTAAEMAVYRRDPLSQAGTERDRLLQLVSDTDTEAGTMYSAAAGAGSSSVPALPPAVSATPPTQFALCAACHPTSSDGASAIGPNLRNVVGRRAGTLDGFQYSSAMKSSGIIWTREELDAFLANVQRKVSGSMMTLVSVPDPSDREAVIAYLQSLR